MSFVVVPIVVVVTVVVVVVVLDAVVIAVVVVIMVVGVVIVVVVIVGVVVVIVVSPVTVQRTNVIEFSIIRTRCFVHFSSVPFVLPESSPSRPSTSWKVDRGASASVRKVQT